MPEELLGHAARATQGGCCGSQAAGRAVGTRWTRQVSGEACRARLVSCGSPVGFWPSAHLRARGAMFVHPGRECSVDLYKSEARILKGLFRATNSAILSYPRGP